MQNALVLLETMQNTLHPAEKRVAEFIKQHPAEVCLWSVQKLAEQTNVSVATVIRLSQRLGFPGFQELKLSLATHRYTVNSAPERYDDIYANMSTVQTIRQMTERAKQSIEDTASVLSPEAVERAVDALLQARKTAFYGVGSSSFVALDAGHKWLRLDRWSFAYNDPQLMMTSAALLRPGDTAIAISYSGKTKETLQAAETAKENGATVISITQAGQNPLAQIADIALWVTASELGIKRGDIGSRIAQSHVIDILYMSLVARSLPSAIPSLEETHTKVQRKKGE